MYGMTVQGRRPAHQFMEGTMYFVGAVMFWLYIFGLVFVVAVVAASLEGSDPQ